MSKRSIDAVSGNGEVTATTTSPSKKAKAALPRTLAESFAAQVFDAANVRAVHERYANSKPYKHAVLQPLVADGLLRAVLDEVRTLHFTEKTTDIYRIWQSGDLANLDGLDAAAMSALPAMRQLRDALYSAAFRAYLSEITGCGPLSGTRTDMAVNIYQPGCYLLCHDDVIGTRRVSYILYLTEEWKPEWGGALRLYATETRARPDDQGGTVRVPLAHHQPNHAIPPGWNQLSLFSVQPGESYHDVEEVYVPEHKEQTNTTTESARTRIAISGWFHLPQEGEVGFAEAMEQRAREGPSSLEQLQRSDSLVDTPQRMPRPYDPPIDRNSPPDPILSEDDLEYLVQYLSPQYLTPDVTAAVRREFQASSVLELPSFLNRATAERVGAWICNQPADLPCTAAVSELGWRVAGPPHKQRFVYLKESEDDDAKAADAKEKGRGKGKATEDERARTLGALWRELSALFYSSAFRIWLALVTRLQPWQVDATLRRFRRGYDYQLAQNFRAAEPRLELTLGLTPGRKQREGTTAWWTPPEEGEEGDDGGQVGEGLQNGHGSGASNGDDILRAEKTDSGGEEIFMAGDDDSDEEDDEEDEAGDNEAGGDPSGEGESGVKSSSTLPPTGGTAAAFPSSSSRKKKVIHDPAVYRPKRSGDAEPENGVEGDDNEDDLLHTNPPSWNLLALVLRDRNTLRAVRYVNRHAEEDRWDVAMEFEADERSDDDEDEDEGEDEYDDEEEGDGEKEEEDENGGAE